MLFRSSRIYPYRLTTVFNTYKFSLEPKPDFKKTMFHKLQPLNGYRHRSELRGQRCCRIIFKFIKGIVLNFYVLQQRSPKKKIEHVQCMCGIVQKSTLISN